MKSEAENFILDTTARAIRLQEICCCEATSALMRYYTSLQADAQNTQNKDFLGCQQCSNTKQTNASLLKQNCVLVVKRSVHTRPLQPTHSCSETPAIEDSEERVRCQVVQNYATTADMKSSFVGSKENTVLFSHLRSSFVQLLH